MTELMSLLLGRSPLGTFCRNVSLRVCVGLLGASTLVGCHTMSESSSYNGTSQQTSYQTKNQDGETVHRTVRVANRNTIDVTPITPITPVYTAPTYPTAAAATSKPEAHATTSSARSSSAAGFNGSLDLAWTSGHLHMGAHAGLSFSEWFMVRLGLSAFVSKDLYLGGDLGTRFHAPLGWIRPFVGAGAYFGDSKKCSYEYNSSVGANVEICDKKFLSAGYGEAGIEFGHVSIFVRDYRLFRAGLSVPTEMFWGVGLQF